VSVLATDDAEIRKFNDTVALFRKSGDQYAMDCLLMMAQGYQESRLDQQAKSQAGAIGMVQVMPATGKDLKVGDIAQVRNVEFVTAEMISRFSHRTVASARAASPPWP
jgi:membrane-bound lytic murein transglycosylase MltF